ncbi:MAG: hypothetical protein ABII27_01610 [bacterium]
MARFSIREMEKRGVAILQRAGWLECMSCGQEWSPMLRPGGRLPRNYWQCPRGCNVVTPTVHICKRCSHSWASKMAEKPRWCPNCKSPYWDKDRKAVKQ